MDINTKCNKVCAIFIAVMVIVLAVLMLPRNSTNVIIKPSSDEVIMGHRSVTTEPTTYIYEPVKTISIEETTKPEETTKAAPKFKLKGKTVTEEEIELIALVTMAEAEGESEKGKRLVIDTILNRVDHEYWPDTISRVIYQPHQFTSMTNGRVDRCYVDEDICELVREELLSRTNYDVVYFTAGAYGKYGEPMFNIGNHYFASYD